MSTLRRSWSWFQNFMPLSPKAYWRRSVAVTAPDSVSWRSSVALPDEAVRTSTTCPTAPSEVSGW